MRLLICGSRSWDDPLPIRLIVSALEPTPSRRHENDVLIEGNARGADRLARKAAEQYDVVYVTFPAEWDRYGKGAGPVRNQQMLEAGDPDVVIAFSDDIENSRGTADMVSRAKKYGVPTYIVRHA